LKQKNINEFPIVMCKIKRESEKAKGGEKIAEVEREIICKGFDGQLVGQLDFGHQVEASLMRCKFNLINRSSASIEITDVRAECKCSKMYIGETRVRPGKSCMITMDISLVKKYKDVAVRGWGTINQVGGTGSTKLIMLIKGYSEPRVLCKPQKIDFGTIKTNSGLARLEGIRVLMTDCGKGQTIKRIESTASNVNISNIRRNIDSVEFDIALDSRDAVGLQTSKINVFLDNEFEAASYFDVMALLQLDCAMSPTVAIVKKGLEAVVTITPKAQRFTVEKVVLSESADYFNVSYSNGAEYSSIRVSVGDKEPPQQLVKDVVAVVIRLMDTQEERVLKIPMIYVPDS
jgi:hypothetical protein